jgi:hypothetical protein
VHELVGLQPGRPTGVTREVRALICVVVVAFASPAFADFTWVAPAACPNADTVRARIEQRLGAPLEIACIAIDITRDRGQFVARLAVGDEVRNLTAPRCDDLADAVAVIVARLAGEHREVRVAAAVVEAPPAPEFDLEMPAVYMRTIAGPRNRHWGGGARLMALSGIGAVPEVGLGAELAGYVRHDDAFVELALARWGTGGVLLHEGAPARVAVGIDLAMARIGWSPERMPIRIWGSYEVGNMSGEGYQLGDPRVGSGRWVAIGAGFGVAWPMTPTARLVGSIEAAVPVMRPTFMLETGDVVYRPSIVTTRVSFGLEIGWK